MPRNVRNFWVDLEVDGRKSSIGAGPVSKTGGFFMRIKIRNKGGIDTAMEIRGLAYEDGKISLVASEIMDPKKTPRAIRIETTR